MAMVECRDTELGGQRHTEYNMSSSRRTGTVRKDDAWDITDGWEKRYIAIRHLRVFFLGIQKCKQECKPP